MIIKVYADGRMAEIIISDRKIIQRRHVGACDDHDDRHHRRTDHQIKTRLGGDPGSKVARNTEKLR